MNKIRLILPVLSLIFLFSCSENTNVKKEKISQVVDEIEKENNNIIADLSIPFVESPRYKVEIDPSELNILVQSELYAVKKIEKELEKKLGFEIKFHYRHFFVDADVIDYSQFDAAIIMKDSALYEFIPQKIKIAKLAKNRLALAVSPELVEYYGNSSKITWEKINKISIENEIKVQIASPGWDIASHAAWMSWDLTTEEGKSLLNNVSELNHGSGRTVINKLVAGKYSAAWMMESSIQKLKENFAREKKEVPFVFYYVEGKQYYPEYNLYSINNKKRDKITAFKKAMTSDENIEKIESLTSMNFINKDNLFSNVHTDYYIKKKSHREILSSIDQYLDENYPKVHTIYVIPNSSNSLKNDILRKTSNSLNSINKNEMNTFETVSSVRKNDYISIISYTNKNTLELSGKIFSELSKKEINDSLSMPASIDANLPYSALSSALDYATRIKSSDPSARVKIVHVVTDQYSNIEETNQTYADFAEEYKRNVLKSVNLKNIEIFNIGLADALLENLNGIAGLSLGTHVDGNEMQFKRTLLILRNYF
jgi:hypothetical protein